MKSKILIFSFFLNFLYIFSFEIINPEKNSPVKGKVNFIVNTEDLKKFETVEYYLNGKRFSYPISKKPYNYSFETSLFYDGEFYAYAVARDINGEIVKKTEPVKFKILNQRPENPLEIKISPSFEKPLKDKVKIKIEVSMPLSKEEIDEKIKNKSELKPIEAIMLFIDGKLEKIQFGSPFLRSKEERIAPPVVMEYELNTRKLQNGKHEIFISVWAHLPGIPPVGMFQDIFEVDNGKTIRDIRPFYNRIYLKVGEKIKVPAYILYTDGSREKYNGEVEYEVKDREIIKIDKNGEILGLKEGVSEVIMKTEGYQNSIPVIVKDFDGFPHFSKDGKILYKYDSGKSIFLRSLFNLGPGEIEKNDLLLKQVKSAEINALTTGFYLNPVDSGTKEYEKWKTNWQNWIKRIEGVTKNNNFSLVLTGDDICRTPGELNNSVTNPWAKEAIKDAFSWARDSGIVACVEMMDEASLWGGNPLPGENETGNWEKANPPSPKDAFKKLMEIINQVENRPPVSWPVLGLSPAVVAKNWMGNPFMSDYTSNYWDIIDWRRAYPYFGASFPQYRKYLDKITYERLPYMQIDKPFLLLVGICGPFYKKLFEGEQFQPGKDKLLIDGIGTAETTSFQIMYAISNGYSGVRCYAFDSSWWKYERKNAKIGTSGLQTGAEPFEVGTDRWYGLSNSFNFIKNFEDIILQEMCSSVDAGPEIITGAKRGIKGNLLIAINSSEVEEKIKVPLFPYNKNSKTISRFRLLGGELITERLNYNEYDEILIRPSEAIIWLFNDDNFSSIKFISPLHKEVIGESKKIIISADNDIEEIKVFLDGENIKTINKRPYEFIIDTEGLKKGVFHSLVAIGKNKNNKESQARTIFFVE